MMREECGAVAGEKTQLGERAMTTAKAIVDVIVQDS